MSAPAGSTALPTVTALVAAYNYERYVGAAIESALAQEYPPALLDVVVVDDGSSDGTAEVVRALSERHPGRVQLITQPNGGATNALNRARRAARGELLGLLDADDIWLPAKTIRQVELLRAQPSLAGVFCDMTVIDGDGVAVRPLIGPETRQLQAKLNAGHPSQYAQVLWGNVATNSSVMVRAEVFDQVPAEIPYADWWLTLNSARISGIGFVAEPLALYRVHGANLTGGASGATLVRERRKEVYFRLHALRHLELDSLSVDELLFVWSGGVERGAMLLHQAAATRFARLVQISDEDRARSRELLALAAQAGAEGDHHREVVLSVKALAWDPYTPGARDLLDAAAQRANRAAQTPHPLEGARAVVVLAEAERLLADPALLDAYAEAMRELQNVTLAIDATRLDADSAEQALAELVEECGLGERDDVDMIAFTGPLDAAQRRRVRAAVSALYLPGGDTPAPQGTGGILAELARAGTVPVFKPADLGALREYANAGEGAPCLQA